MELQKSRRDGRLRALLITGGLIIAGGLSIAYLPDLWHASAAGGSAEARAEHAREKTVSEIRQRFDEGVLMLNDKKYEQALKAFHRVLELSPDMPEAHVNAGFALNGLGQFAVARDFFEGAIELRKTQLNAYYGLAEALAGLQDYPGALGAMRTFLHLASLDDPYRHMAESAARQWESKMAETNPTTGMARKSTAFKQAGSAH